MFKLFVHKKMVRIAACRNKSVKNNVATIKSYMLFNMKLRKYFDIELLVMLLVYMHISTNYNSDKLSKHRTI